MHESEPSVARPQANRKTSLFAMFERADAVPADAAARRPRGLDEYLDERRFRSQALVDQRTGGREVHPCVGDVIGCGGNLAVRLLGGGPHQQRASR